MSYTIDSSLLLSLAPHVVLAAIVALAAHNDLRRRRIPNWLTLSLALSGLAASLIRPDLTFGQSAAGLGVGLLVPFVLFALGMLGAGDAKLLAAIGSWMGPTDMLWVLLFTALAGGVMSLALAFWQGRLGVLFRNTSMIGMNLLTTRQTGWVSATEVARASVLQKTTLPYAIAILAGLLATQAMMFVVPLLQRG